jgi:hypothetical protein
MDHGSAHSVACPQIGQDWQPHDEATMLHNSLFDLAADMVEGTRDIIQQAQAIQDQSWQIRSKSAETRLRAQFLRERAEEIIPSAREGFRCWHLAEFSGESWPPMEDRVAADGRTRPPLADSVGTPQGFWS